MKSYTFLRNELKSIIYFQIVIYKTTLEFCVVDFGTKTAGSTIQVQLILPQLEILRNLSCFDLNYK